MNIYIADLNDPMFDFVLEYDHEEFMAELREDQETYWANARFGEANGMYGKKHSKKVVDKLKDRKGDKNPMYGKKHSKEFVESARERAALLKNNPKWKKWSNSRKGKPKPKISCPHCGKMGAAGIIHRWHFDNCKQKRTEAASN